MAMKDVTMIIGDNLWADARQETRAARYAGEV